MSKLLWSLSSIDNRVAPLVFVIRRWAREASITQSSPGPWFSNFQMTLLVLFYFQSIDVLPKLKYINEQSSASSPESMSNNGKHRRWAKNRWWWRIRCRLGGDLRDDLVLITELENLRHVRSNSGNNQSLGEFSTAIRFRLRRTWPFSSGAPERLLRVLREVRLSIVSGHSTRTGEFNEVVVQSIGQRQRLADLSGESSRSVDERLEESRRVRRRAISLDVCQSVWSLVELVDDAFVSVRRMSSIRAQWSHRSSLSSTDRHHAGSRHRSRSRSDQFGQLESFCS